MNTLKKKLAVLTASMITSAAVTVPLASTAVTVSPVEYDTPAVYSSATLLGDANCDGEVTIADYELVMTWLEDPTVSPTEQGLINADVYDIGDGIDSMDAIEILNLATNSSWFKLDSYNITNNTVELTAYQSKSVGVDIYSCGSNVYNTNIQWTYTSDEDITVNLTEGKDNQYVDLELYAEKTGTYEISVTASNEYYTESYTFTVNVTESDLIGDVNCDGKLTVNDARMLMNWLSDADSESPSEQGCINADFNQDSEVSMVDYVELVNYLKETGIYYPGDVDCSGDLTARDAAYLLGWLQGDDTLIISETGRDNADYDNNGQVDMVDYTQLVEYLEENGIYLLGDANCDGKVTEDDYKLVKELLENPGTLDLTEQGFYNADCDLDDDVDMTDAIEIRGIATDYYWFDLELSDYENNTIEATAGKSDSVYVDVTYYGDNALANTITWTSSNDIAVVAEEVQESGSAYVELEILADEAGEYEVTVTADNGKYTNSVTFTVNVTAENLLGDVNCDGKVTEDDYKLVKELLENPGTLDLTEQGFYNADCDLDDDVDMTDAREIRGIATDYYWFDIGSYDIYDNYLEIDSYDGDFIYIDILDYGKNALTGNIEWSSDNEDVIFVNSESTYAEFRVDYDAWGEYEVTITATNGNYTATYTFTLAAYHYETTTTSTTTTTTPVTTTTTTGEPVFLEIPVWYAEPGAAVTVPVYANDTFTMQSAQFNLASYIEPLGWMEVLYVESNIMDASFTFSGMDNTINLSTPDNEAIVIQEGTELFWVEFIIPVDAVAGYYEIISEGSRIYGENGEDITDQVVIYNGAIIIDVPTTTTKVTTTTTTSTTTTTATTTTIPSDTPVIIPETLTMNAGDTAELAVMNVPDGTSVKWLSDNTSVATVTDGTVTAVAEGTAVIYAIVGDTLCECTVTVISESTETPIPEGDANGDGEVTVADVVAIMIHISTPGGTLSADIIIIADVYQKGDGISNMDALSIQKKIAQLISVLPESYMV